MEAQAQSQLCRPCRNLNLRIETFVETGWRFPTSLEYETIEDIFGSDTAPRQNHHVPREFLDGDIDYSSERLSEKLEAPPFVDEFDEDGVLKTLRPAKRKSLGKLRDVLKKADGCALCGLIAYTVLEEGSRHLKGLRNAGAMLEMSDECKIRFDYRGNNKGSSSTAHGTVGISDAEEKDAEERETQAYGRYTCEISIGRYVSLQIYPLIENPDVTWFGGRLYGIQADFVLLRRWFDACEGMHPNCRVEPGQFNISPISRLRIIDVHKNCLVDAVSTSAPYHCRYLALSYVWGSVPMFTTKKRFLKSLYKEGGLEAHMDTISLTVRDAMQVARELGERYLWTDAICIVQDDPAEKDYLIQQMDAVYAAAALTIVAAEGASAETGLTGLRPNSRSVPTVFQYSGELKLFAARAPVWETLLGCPWSTRAWTYQEAQLSSRLLIFTNDTIHFVCGSTTWSEDVNSDSEKLPPPWKCANESGFQFRSTLVDVERNEATGGPAEGVEVFDLWQDIVMDLSGRNLSFETDILFAAAGLLNLLQRLYGVTSIYGMPEHCLEDSMYWSPVESGDLRRRVDPQGKPYNPSWSWSGWVGEISWMGGAIESVKSFKSPMIDLSKRESTTSSTVPLNNTRRPGGEPDSPERQWPLLQLSTRASKFRISSTDVAPQWVEELQPYAWSVVKPKGVKREGVYCIMTCADAREAVGSFVADSIGALGMEIDREHEFVLISSWPQTVDVGDFAGQVFYNVLAVKWKGDIAERVGSGRILASHWEASNWERKEIILG